MRKQAGFTLIELVVVIIILGILAATALPRFADLSVEAREAAVEGLAGGVRAGAALAHSLQLAKQYTQGQPVTMDGVSIAMVNGYPTSASIDLVLQDRTGFGFTQGSPSRFFKQGVANSTTCEVTYAEAPAGGAPQILVDTSDCS